MRKILLIEDNPEMRENTAEILELANYQVAVAEHGKIGVRMAQSDPPDLIICDIMMPELDGYGVLYMLAKNPKTSSVPFIFLTAKADKSDYRKGMNLGADDYLTKPFEEMELLEAVEIRLKKSQQFQKGFESDQDGIDQFIEEAKGLEELNKLSQDRKSRRYKKKEALFYEGEYPNFLYFIHQGKIKTSKMNEDGKELTTGLYKEGDFIGYLALLENREYPESAVVLEDSEVYLIPRHDFMALLFNNRDVSARFIKMLSRDLVEKEQELLNLAYNTVRKRVADALLQLKARYHTDKLKDFSMAISRDDLASMVGTAKESVIRTLSEFKKDAYIAINGSKITLLEPDKLASLRY
ncbi:MAG: transcriptional regulator [Cyclobacteriaceae bacterium]|nr:MAG: transcriptional regulator [Cyclobacteriaceae bacterium]